VSTQTWTVFDVKTRLPVSCVTCREKDLPKRVKDGQVAIAGRHRGSVRLNSNDEVEIDSGRSLSAQNNYRRDAQQARVEELERLRSRRAERELLLAIAEHVGLDSHDAYARLKAISDEIEALRSRAAT
jgi:hypothetical protein